VSDRKITVFEALALDLKAQGVEHAFGLLSEDTAMLAAMLDSAGVQFHNARHESNAAAMAEGYAAASGKLGVAILGRGPATANGMHGIGYVQRSASGVLVICGEAPLHAPRNSFGPDNKAFDGVAALRAAGFQPFVATSAAGARQMMADASIAARAGSAVLLLPVDVQAATIGYEQTQPFAAVPATPKPIAPRRAAVKAAASVINGCKRPLIIAGKGARHARDALAALADHTGAALATTFKAKDLFRGHPLDCGMVGSFAHAGGRRLIQQADCVVAFGAGLNQRTTAKGTALPMDVPLIQVDVQRSHMGRWLHADIAIVSDAELCARALVESVDTRGADAKEFHGAAYRGALAAFKLEDDFKPMHTSRTIDTRAAALVLDRLVPRDRNLVYDAGNFLMVAPYLSVTHPQRLKQAGDFSSVGMGLPVAIGFAVAAPERVTLCVVGDGGFMMALSELETAARCGVPLVVVVMNDCAYGAEVHFLKMNDMPTAVSIFPDTDFAPVAEPFGFETATVRTIAELEALAPLLASPQGPILIDCKVNGSLVAPFLHDGQAGTSSI